MLDNLKFTITDQALINRLYEREDFMPCKSPNNRYSTRKHQRTDKIKLHFYKVKGGFSKVDLQISPHYHFNDYRHNGNDFSPQNCIKALKGIFALLGIKPQEYEELKPVNVEYGVNIITSTNPTEIVANTLYYKKTPFVNMQGLESAKISNGTAYKQIKIYDKGLQCHEVLNAPEIDRNTLRFEIRTKQFKNIRKLGLWNAGDLLHAETYERLGQSLNEEFKFILILDKTADLSDLKNQEREFIIKANKEDFWDKNLHDYTLKKFIRYRKKYKEIMQSKKIKHSENLGQKISEKIAKNNVLNSTKKLFENENFNKNEDTNLTPISLEFRTFFKNDLIKHLDKLVKI